MAEYQLLIPEDLSFAEEESSISSQAESIYGPVDGSQKDVRRPLNALETRKDTYASLSILRGSGRAQISNTSADNGLSQHTTNLMVQSINYSTQEKMQLSQTFDRDRLLFFGTQVPTLQVSAILIENETFQWLHEFYENYVSTMSGSELARTGSRAELVVEDKRFEGYLTNLSFERNAQDRHTASINFTLSITRTEFTRELGVLPARRKTLSQDGLKSLQDLSQNFSNALINLEVAEVSARSFEQQVLALSNESIFSFGEQTTDAAAPTTRRQAYPLEYVNAPEGTSKDVVRELYTADKAKELYEKSRKVVVATTRRDQLLASGYDGRIQVKSVAPTEPIEDILFNTKYEKFVPSAMSVEMTQLVRVGKALAVVAGRSLLSESLGFTADTTGEIYLDTLEVAGRAF